MQYIMPPRPPSPPTTMQLEEPQKPPILLKELTNKKYTISQLKVIARTYKLHVSGTKTILENRIKKFLHETLSSIKIQKIFRGWMVREIFKIRGPAFSLHLRKLCVNDTDFYTLEHMQEIPHEYFCSYRDEKGLIYGFHIESLIALFTKKNTSHSTAQNPYTREEFPPAIAKSLFRFIRFYHILRPDIKLVDMSNFHMIYFTHSGVGNAGSGGHLQNMVILQNLKEIREKTLEQRIINLFIDIDMLGNYTSPSWFTNLSMQHYMVFWNELYDIWLFRAEIMNETKKLICPIHDPFFRKNLNHYDGIVTRDVIIEHCLYAMENMVYMAEDEEYRKLGAMYVLTALTMISLEARRAMPWLFDVIGY